ncbi:MAG: OmpA family protein [Hyphomicrobiaceae bacterium]|nr:OmpA family protein [Hyphomicrobiaceae bacterium]
MTKFSDSALPSPAARRLAAAGGPSAAHVPLKLQRALAKADRARTRIGLIGAAVGLALTIAIAAFVSSLPRIGPSPVQVAASLGADVFRRVPPPVVPDPAPAARQVAQAPGVPVVPASPTQPPAPQSVVRPPDVPVVAAPVASAPIISAPEPRTTEAPRPVVVAAAPLSATPSAAPTTKGDAVAPAPPAFEALDPTTIVAPIALKLQSLEERLTALNAAAEAERRDAETRAIERREQEKRDAERREAARKLAEQQRLAALQPQVPVAAVPGADNASTPKKANCLAAIEAATQTMLISFDSGSVAISPVQLEQLKRLGALLKSCPDAKLEVAGHTDSKGVAESNFSLSWRRAEAVIEVFQSVGVDVQRFTAVGYGTRRPLSRTAEQQNPIDRRVDMSLR